MRCEQAHDDGAYVLGALAPAERAEFERHLPTCPSCQSSVAELAALPGLLARLDVETAERVALDAGGDEPSRLPRLLRTVEESRQRDRRRRRWRTVAAGLVAACLVALASVTLTLALRPSGAGGSPAEVSPVAMASMSPPPGAASTSPVTAEIGLRQLGSGTQVWMHCGYPPRAGSSHKQYTFRLVAFGTGGEKEQVASWKAGSGEDLSLDGITRLTTDELDRIELQRADGSPLLVYEVS